MRMVWSQDALQTSSLSHHRTDDTASLCPDNVIKGVCAQENKNSFCNDLVGLFSSQSYSGCALTLVRPSCWVFCFFLGLSAGSSISSCSSVGTDSTGNIVYSSITTIPFLTIKRPWIILGSYLLTRSSTFCPRSHCRTESVYHKHPKSLIAALFVVF